MDEVLNKLKNKFFELQKEREENSKKEEIIKNNNKKLDTEFTLIQSEIVNLNVLKLDVLSDSKKLPVAKRNGWSLTLCAVIIALLVSILSMNVLSTTKFLISLIAIISGSAFISGLGFSEYFEIKKFLKKNPIKDIEAKIENKTKEKNLNREKYMSNKNTLENLKMYNEYIDALSKNISGAILEMYPSEHAEITKTNNDAKQQKLGIKKDGNN